MVKRFSDGDIWEKDWFLDLDDNQKLLTKFLFDKCDCAGIYEISWRMIKMYFKSDIQIEDFKKIKQVRFLNEKTVFIEDFVLFQCGIDSLNSLNPNNNAHKGIIKRLKKYNLLLAPSEPLISPSIGAQEKEKEKDINNLINNSINTDINVEKVKKIDPYINPIVNEFKSLHEKIIGRRVYLNSAECNKLIELAADVEDFSSTLPTVFEKLKKMKWDRIGYKPNASWLLKDNNYTAILNGAYDVETREEIFERKRQEELKRRSEYVNRNGNRLDKSSV